MSPAPGLVTLAPPAVALLFKVTGLCAAAGALAAALRGRSASTRHLVWQCALVGSVALLALLPLAPRIDVTLPDRVARMLTPSGDLSRTQGSIAPTPPTPEAADVAHTSRVPSRGAAPARRIDPASVLALCWLIGTLAVLIAQAAAHGALRRLEAAARPIDREDVLAEVATLRRQLGVRATVRVRASAQARGPLTWGWKHAIVLLPADWHAWSRERLRIVLLHELAHVERADYAVQWLASLACALYWFHPLVWSSASRLRRESELACDDRVLGAGTPASDYAHELLSLARDVRAQRQAASIAIGMARPSQIEGRLLAMLDDCRSRTALSARAARLTQVFMLLTLMPLAGVTVAVSATRTTRTLHHETPQSVPADAESRVQRTFAAHDGGRLTLDLPAGAVLDMQGWDRSEVAITAQLAGKDWRRTALEFDPKSDGVTVHLRPDNLSASYSSSHSLTVRVPRRYDIHIESAGGDVGIREVSGHFDGHTGGGTIELSHLHGSADLHTGGGHVVVTDCTLSGSVTTGGGGIELDRVQGGLNTWSGSGDNADKHKDRDESEASGGVTNLRGDADEHKGDWRSKDGGSHESRAGGAIELDDAPHGASLETGGGAIRVGAAGGDVSAKTGGGPIELGPVAGSVRASTGAGLVHVRLTDAGGRRQDVDVWSGTGRVILELPRTLDATFDLETAYTRSNGGPTRIHSDFSLDHSETTNWDPTQGTPRRYVRAKGVSGSGRGHVQVRTVNGDIEVRRLDR